MSVCTFGWAPIFALARHCSSCLCSLRSCFFLSFCTFFSLTSVHSVRMQKFLRYSITLLIKFCIFAISRCSMCISTEYVCTDMHEIMYYMLCVCAMCMMYTFLTRICVNLDRLRWTMDVCVCVSEYKCDERTFDGKFSQVGQLTDFIEQCKMQQKWNRLNPIASDLIENLVQLQLATFITNLI